MLDVLLDILSAVLDSVCWYGRRDGLGGGGHPVLTVVTVLLVVLGWVLLVLRLATG